MLSIKKIILYLLLVYIIYRSQEHLLHLKSHILSTQLDLIHYNQERITKPQDYQLNWMAKLNDDIPISLLTIPGSHNTGTFACPKLCMINQCQSYNISQQLKAGIRHLDLRVNDQRPLTIYHGPFRITQISPLLRQASDFLKQNPTQFLTISFQFEIGKITPDPLILQQIKKSGLIPFYSKTIPTVGQLRGKAFIISGVGIWLQNSYRIQGYYGIWDLPQAYIQNMFILFPWDVKYKKQIVKHTRQVQCSMKRFKINFWTGAFAVLPYMMARLSKGPNRTGYDWLKANPGKKCLGINMIDYPSVALIKQLIKTNFN